MEQKIREYEEFIEAKANGKLGSIERGKLIKYHQEMVSNFQHERLVHLLIMLFFVSVSLGLLVGVGWLAYNWGVMAELIPFYLLTLVVVVLTIYYVKHYYFLENRIQRLYEYTKK